MTDFAIHSDCPFSEKTFHLLGQLSQKDFYQAHREEYQEFVEKPFEKLCSQVIAQLPGNIIKRTETVLDNSLNFTDKCYKCDFYKKEADFNSRNASLFIDITQEDFRFGLFIVDSSPDKQRFIQNSQKSSIKEIIFQHTHLPKEFQLYSLSSKDLDYINRLGDWLRLLSRQNSATKHILASFHLNWQQVFQSSSEELSTQIKQTFEGIFPLFLLATCDDPITDIRDYLDSRDIFMAQRIFESGVIKYREGNYQDAIKKFDLALEKAPNLADAYSFRGKAKAELGDIDGAITDCNQSLLIQPKNAEIYDNRGNVYFKIKDYDAAIKDYTEALNINPSFALAYQHRGLAYLELDNHQSAIEDLLRAAELFDKQQDVNNYEEVQRIIKTIQPGYSEPSLTEICQNVCSKMRIAERTLRRYHLALTTRKFVILAGISGTGKTWLTKAYAEAVKAEYLLVSVAPNWTTNEDLLGYFNPIDKEYHYTNLSRFLEKAAQEYEQAKANQRTPQPYHLVLDEMNLARVEYYFAKFLSAMEVRMREGVAQIELAPEKEVLLPPNLYFIGTVNVDETTHGFADKVYDRSQLIELEVCRENLDEHLGEVPYRQILMQIWDEVHSVAPFAFRVLDEIKTYVTEAEALGLSWQEAVDEQLLQKILPKLKGADDRVGVALKAFVNIAEEKGFSLSYKKAAEMLETFDKHEFTSFF